ALSQVGPSSCRNPELTTVSHRCSPGFRHCVSPLCLPCLLQVYNHMAANRLHELKFCNQVLASSLESQSSRYTLSYYNGWFRGSVLNIATSDRECQFPTREIDHDSVSQRLRIVKLPHGSIDPTPYSHRALGEKRKAMKPHPTRNVPTFPWKRKIMLHRADKALGQPIDIDQWSWKCWDKIPARFQGYKHMAGQTPVLG
ncbi:uncharacterized protein BO95DRAFT_488254, partial [Aspergillus brunneoviolaceus CBS 621.78]